MTIYILLSIKTRIETPNTEIISVTDHQFISYYPLKQGLKHGKGERYFHWWRGFISYYPLKQGLKLLPDGKVQIHEVKIYILLSIKTRIETFIYLFVCHYFILIYILLSIKTRIETLLPSAGSAISLYNCLVSETRRFSDRRY